jgi:hypothetical protein
MRALLEEYGVKRRDGLLDMKTLAPARYAIVLAFVRGALGSCRDENDE